MKAKEESNWLCEVEVSLVFFGLTLTLDFLIKRTEKNRSLLHHKFHIGLCLLLFIFSFQSDFSLNDKTALVKSVSDTDAKLLVVLPKGGLHF